MVVMPLQIGRPRSLSPQPHHRNEYQHSPHPPSHPMKQHQHSRGSPRGPEVCGKALGAFVTGLSPSHHSPGADPGVTRLHSHEDSVLEVAAVQNRQLAMRLGQIDRESQRLLKTRQREAAEVRRIRKDIQKHSVYDSSSSIGRGSATGRGEKLSDVLSHAPINLNLPRVSSRQNSPSQSPARTRKAKVVKKVGDKANNNKEIKVVVKDYSQDVKAINEPQRTSSDSDLRENNKLLSPGARKRSMSATSLFQRTSLSDDFAVPEATSRSATSSPQNTPTIQIEQCFDDLAFPSNDTDLSEGFFDSSERGASSVDDESPNFRTRRGKHVWEVGLSPIRRARSPAELRKSQGVCFTSTPHCKQYHDHHSFGESSLRSSKSESNVNTCDDNGMLDPRFQRLTSVLVPNTKARSSDDVSDNETVETRSSSQTSSPSSSFLQLPTLRVSDGMYEENLAGLSPRLSEVSEPRSPSQERRVSPPTSASQIPALPEVHSPRSPLTSPRGSPRASPRSPRRKVGHGVIGLERKKSEGSTYLAPAQGDFTSPPTPPLFD